MLLYFQGRWLNGRCTYNGKIQNKGKIKIKWMPNAEKCLQFCEKKKGMYFIHEHPQGASSWKEPCMQELLCKRSAVAISAK